MAWAYLAAVVDVSVCVYNTVLFFGAQQGYKQIGSAVLLMQITSHLAVASAWPLQSCCHSMATEIHGTRGRNGASMSTTQKSRLIVICAEQDDGAV